MYREISRNLVEWKNSKHRKPLLLLGVRQCGKTYILKDFGKNEFDNICYINFESANNYSEIFDYNFDVKRIVKEIELITGINLIPGKTLLIMDEIQECPKALTSLKYFCEDLPELHVACAGSLLGVVLKKENISFPVGKVNRLQMFPMNFKEFLISMKEEKYINLLSNWNFDRQIPEIYHKPLTELLKTYYLVGGMPEAVLEYINTKNFESVKIIQDEILADYADDFSKHVPYKDIEKIRMIW